jgi:116 kDa U5 small nuclear ribonucleoprotein component
VILTRFGNYIGDDTSIVSGEDVDQEDQTNTYDQYLNQESEDEGVEPIEVDESVGNQIILHEDKKYYPSASEVFGADVEVTFHERDTQSLAEPIIAPVQSKTFNIEETDLPEVYYSREFQMSLMNFPEQIRNFSIVGHLHHGKTSLMDVLVGETHNLKEGFGKREGRAMRYTDTHILERERGLSIFNSPMSLLLKNSKGKSYLFNILDTPGHVDFIDEIASAARLADGYVVVIDVIEGIQVNTQQIIRQALKAAIPFVVVLNKVDRLILELRLPPADAYLKIKHTIDQVNRFIKESSPTHVGYLHPTAGNVLFASAKHGWITSVPWFARYYSQKHKDIDYDSFNKRLWGNWYIHKTSGEVTRNINVEDGPATWQRTFIHFILEPIYKLYTQVISSEPEQLSKTLKSLGIYLKDSQLRLNAEPLLKLVLKEFFKDSSALSDSILKHIHSPEDSARRKISQLYTGPQDSSLAETMRKLNPDGPVIGDIVKLYNNSNSTEFYALARIYSGTISRGTSLKVLGESYTVDDEEDMSIATVTDLWIPQTRYKIPIDSVPCGNWVLIGGIDSSIAKTATIVSADISDDLYTFSPVSYLGKPIFKVAVEPVNPSELPKMLDGLRKVNKSYAVLQTKVEESGEHIVLGTGELYMDCVMHDLRKVYAEIDVKVSDPITRFSETCIDISTIKSFAETPNKRNRLTIVAEPLDEKIGNDIEDGKIEINWPVKELGNYFHKNYDWDLLASRSIWAFGPDDFGCNILQDDTIPSEVDKSLLNNVRESIKQGFQWSTREGPLCEENIRLTKFRILDVSLAQEGIYRGGGQIIPTARRACYSAFLLASPRLLEPVYQCSVTCSGDAVPVVYDLLSKRRGNVWSDIPIPGTPLYSVNGSIPVLDSFGFETDLRIATEGRAITSLVFEKWQIVPGDPLDRHVKVPPLRPAALTDLARDCVLKTRRRKGLSDEPSLVKYLEPSLVNALMESGLIDE